MLTRPRDTYRKAYMRWFRERYPDYPRLDEYSNKSMHDWLTECNEWEARTGISKRDVDLHDEFEKTHYFDGTSWVAYDEWPQMNVS